MISHVMGLVVVFNCLGQAESESDRHAKMVDAWMEVCTTYAQDYKISPAKGPQQEFKMLRNPVFRHAQAARGSLDIGAVWLWVDEDDRPAVIGTVFVWPNTGTPFHDMIHEFHSLADVPLTAVWRKRKAWEPDRPGLEWKPLPAAPIPAESAVKRLRQIRELSRRFKAHSIAHDGGRWELRLISRPLYHYETKKQDVLLGKGALGGALFAFCQGTDPEIILAIEARRTADGFRWHYGCAAFSDYHLHVQLDGAEVWAPPRGTMERRTHPHWVTGFPSLTLPASGRAPAESPKPRAGSVPTDGGRQ